MFKFENTGIGLRALTEKEILERRLSKLEEKVNKIIEYMWSKETRERLFNEKD